MPAVYAKYKEQLEGYFAKKPELRKTAREGEVMAIPAADAEAIAATPAGRVLAAVAHGTFDEFYQAFIDVYTDGQFRWVGSQGFSQTRVMETLDGDRTSGECAILANAFWALWACPRPFGLGQGGALLFDFDNGDPENGFIAPHPPGGVRALGPNILHPFGEPGDLRNTLYSWGNHKVILYNGRYYDPTYRAIYRDPSQMVAFRYTGRSQMVNGERITEIEVVTPNVARGWRTGQLMFLRTDPTMRLVGPYRAVGGWKP